MKNKSDKNNKKEKLGIIKLFHIQFIIRESLNNYF